MLMDIIHGKGNRAGSFLFAHQDSRSDREVRYHSCCEWASDSALGSQVVRAAGRITWARRELYRLEAMHGAYFPKKCKRLWCGRILVRFSLAAAVELVDGQVWVETVSEYSSAD